MTRRVVLDTETTGLKSEEGHRIIEVACLEVLDRRVTRNTFYRRIHPGRDIDEGATAVHGITLADLEHEPPFEAIADELIRFIEGAELIIHNAPFDVGFLDAELARLNKPGIATFCTVTDTLAMARERFPGRKNSLDALCERFAIDNSHRTFHGALLDAELLAEVYFAMTRGQNSLAIGLDLPGSTSSAQQAASLKRPQNLRRIELTDEERERHRLQVEEIQKASKGKAVWARYLPPDAPPLPPS